jgi:hypothetical protein
MKRALAAVAATLTLAGAAAPLAAQDYSAERVKKSVDQNDLLAVVGSLGHQVREQGTADDIFVAAESEDGVTYVLFGSACNVNEVSGCQGIMMQVRYDLPPGTTAQTLAAANLEQAALNTWADFENKTLGFTRYVVLDHGVTMANIRENVNVLLAITEEAYPIAVGEPVESAPAS